MKSLTTMMTTAIEQRNASWKPTTRLWGQAYLGSLYSLFLEMNTEVREPLQCPEFQQGFELL